MYKWDTIRSWDSGSRISPFHWTFELSYYFGHDFAGRIDCWAQAGLERL